MLGDNEYTEEELDGLNTWFQLEHEKLPTSPFKFYFIKLKSGSDEAVELFMDPNRTLRGIGSSLEALPGVTEQSRVTTTIIGHERTLKARMMYAVAAVDAQDDSVSITSHKAKPASG